MKHEKPARRQGEDGMGEDGMGEDDSAGTRRKRLRHGRAGPWPGSRQSDRDLRAQAMEARAENT
jgi:hypothetical protein